MKAYSIPRNDDVENPDTADSRNYGMKTSRANTPRGQGDDTRSQFKSPHAKATTRRYFKRLARANGKLQCLNIDE